MLATVSLTKSPRSLRSKDRGLGWDGFIYRLLVQGDMPKGLKQTSGIIVISSSATETGANTFTQAEIDLQLNVLDREVFVVTSVDINSGFPDSAAGANTNTRMSLSTTSRTTMGGLSNSNVLAVSNLGIRAAGFVDGGVAFQHLSPETPPAQLDYVGIIATNNFFIQIEGTGNAGAKSGSVRVWGYRSQASADVFAALTQSELLSQ